MPTSSEHSMTLRCVRASCCDESQGQLSAVGQWRGNATAEHVRLMRLKEAIMIYKLRAVRDELRQSASAAVVMLDLDALVLSPSCLTEWLSYLSHSDLAIQSGGRPGCPRRAFVVMGVVANTGAFAAKSEAALPLLDAILEQREAWGGNGYPYENHCWEQELFNRLVAGIVPRHNASRIKALSRLGLPMGFTGEGAFRDAVEAQPRWLDFPNVLQTQVHLLPEPLLTQPVSLRLLPFSRWPSGNEMQMDGRLLPRHRTTSPNMSWHKQVEQRYGPILHLKSDRDTCIVHLDGDGAKSPATWARRGLWYLNNVSGFTDAKAAARAAGLRRFEKTGGCAFRVYNARLKEEKGACLEAERRLLENGVWAESSASASAIPPAPGSPVHQWFERVALNDAEPLHVQSGWSYLNSQEWAEVVRGVVDSMEPPPRENSSVFEFGCGVGASLTVLRDGLHVGKLGGVDFSRNALGQVKKHFPEFASSFLLGDMSTVRLPVGDGTYDHVVSQLVENALYPV